MAIALACLGVLLATSSLATAVSFEYMPDRTVGDVRASLNPRRCLEVSWKGHNILTQGGELFTCDYQRANLEGTWPSTGPLGFYRLDDTQPEFDIPVCIEETTNGLCYTWSCDAFAQGYRQINRALIRADQVVVTTTLVLWKNTPAEINFHPVFFPGRELGHNSGEPDNTLGGREFQISDYAGSTTSLTYPTIAPATAWYDGDCASLSTTLPEGQVRVKLYSEDPHLPATLYAFAKWPMYVGGRRGLVAHMGFRPATIYGATVLTYSVVIQFGATSVEIPAALDPADLDSVKMVPVLAGRRFWFFNPNETVGCKVQVANYFGTNARSFTLNWRLNDYANACVLESNLPVQIELGSAVELPLEFGKLARGAYALELNAIQDSHLIGYASTRLGVVPDHQVVDTDVCLGGNVIYDDNPGAQIDLIRWVGIGRLRFRNSLHDERWSYFEPAQGQYVKTLPSVALAQQYLACGIPLTHHGEHLIPQLPPVDKLLPWLTYDQVELINYHSAEKKLAYLPKDLSLYGRYIREWAGRHAGIMRSFAIFNEPDPALDPATAARIIQVVSTNIKAVIPDASIVACEQMDLSPKLLGWLTNVLEKASNYVDVVTYHQYKQGWYKWEKDDRFPVIEDAGWEDEIRRVVALAKGYGKKVWNGEISWVAAPAELFPSGTFQPGEKDTANIQVRSYLLTRANGVDTLLQCFAPTLRKPDARYILYPERAAGLVGWGWMTKPWAVAHATLSELLDTAQYVDRVQLPDSAVYFLCFDRPDRRWAAAWRSKGTALVSNPFRPSEVNLLSVVGQPLTMTGTLTLSESPVYLQSDSLSKAEFLQRVSTIHLVNPAISSPSGLYISGE